MLVRLHTRIPSSREQGSRPLISWIGVDRVIMEALILVATSADRRCSRVIGVMRALNRHVKRVFNPDRKDHHWGRPEASEGSMTGDEGPCFNACPRPRYPLDRAPFEIERAEEEQLLPSWFIWRAASSVGWTMAMDPEELVT